MKLYLNTLSFVLLSIALLSSCEQKHNVEKVDNVSSLTKKISEIKFKGIDDVIDYYGGICNHKIGFEIKDSVNQSFFELEITDSDLLESYSDFIELPSSNIAYLIYNSLNAEDRKIFSVYRVIIQFKDGSKDERDYTVEKLAIIPTKVEHFKKVNDLIVNQDYEQLHSLFDTVLTKSITVDQISSLCKAFDDKYGTIDSVLFQGFSYFKVRQIDDNEMLHLIGILTRKNHNTPLSIYFNPTKKEIEHSLYTVKFKL